MSTHLHLVLGSSSPSRKMVLKKLGVPFECLSPDIDESALANEAPDEHVRRLAKEKGQRVAELLSASNKICPCRNYWIISSDQIALLNGQLISKPLDRQDAKAQLEASSGRPIIFYNGLCLLNLNTQQMDCTVDTSTVHYRTLSDAQIEHYLTHEDAYGCAGTLKSEGLGIALIEKIESKDPNSLIGLPLVDLCTLFKKNGIDLLSSAAWIKPDFT